MPLIHITWRKKTGTPADPSTICFLFIKFKLHDLNECGKCEQIFDYNLSLFEKLTMLSEKRVNSIT